MSKQRKRARITPSKTASSGITIREVWKDRHGSQYLTHLVQGWQEDGKWKRKEFKDRKKAEAFMASKIVELQNSGRHQDLVLSALNQEEQDEAEAAIKLLKGVYSLTEAVDYFLKNHRAPDFTISLSEAARYYLEEIEEDVSKGQFNSIRQTLNRLAKREGDPNISEVGSNSIRSYLKSLRAKDGVTKASRQSWNTHQSNLNKFFKWATNPEEGPNHPLLFSNPMVHIKRFTKKQIAVQRPDRKSTTSIEEVLRRLTVLMRWRDGEFAAFFALLYFAGIRPSELEKISLSPEEFINRKTGFIEIPASISKTKEPRKTTISANLAAWLDAFPGPIKPPNYKRKKDRVWEKFGIKRNELRHSFCSYHVALHRSVGNSALEAGNSERVLKKHYLNLFSEEDGKAFFSIYPDMEKRTAIIKDC